MKYREEITRALTEAMEGDPRTLILGEGVADPKGIFGTTLAAAQKFPERVIETPLSETMLTGACLGLALEGWKPIYVHARADFLMLTMEHMVNTVSKWSMIHQGRGFSLVMRALVGRGWGQGPNHSQALHATFAHMPGLRVLYPVNPRNVSSWVDQAINGGLPTIIMEPRRLYEVDSLDFPTWDKPDIFIVTFGDIVLDAAQSALELEKFGIKAQVYPIEDVSALPVPQTDAPVLVADTGHLFFGAAAEVMARLVEGGNSRIKRLGPPFSPLPTSVELERQWYPTTQDILEGACSLLDIQPIQTNGQQRNEDGFKGPF